MLDTISEQLNACQSALNQYMEEKRSIFPRLYFLSDDDLLELLGQARAGAHGRELVMQTHLKKLFPGISGVLLGPGEVTVATLCSQYGETFTLDQPVGIDCPVEVWLNNLEQEIRSSLKSLTLKCLVANNLPHQDPFSLPTQILCLLQNIRFTEQAEVAIAAKELRKLKDNIEKENIYYAEADVDNKNEKCKRQALILQCSYYASVVQSLIDHNVVTVSEWAWQRQLRFYVVNKQEVVAKMGLAEIVYSYEYLGVETGQFVRTDTTDESFFILTQALHLGFVGNPFGPAGTGKTESVKALGSLVGRLVLVFNCDEAMDEASLARLLSGVAQCGAWGCFDEFNRLHRAALAAAAHQLTALLGALDARHDTVVLRGSKVPLSRWCGVAVTLNPAGRGYGGRRELPAALQAALRPLALRPAEPALLAARLLAALAPCLYPDHYRRLGEDLDSVFDLAGTLLSSERHYDWGLRALKATVSSCGAALAERAGRGERVDGLRWRRAVLRSVLRLNNLSKLTPHDANRFERILSLVFADIPEDETPSELVRSAVEDAVAHLALVQERMQIQKCVELYEQLQQRMGVVIVGPPGSGKTTIRKLLKTALVHRGRSIVEHVIRPKALEPGRLPDVLHAVALQAAGQPDEVWSWVVLDGDVEPDWAESLNSVLDDNRLLTLPSGERVSLSRGVSFLFETDALSAASPATLTRLAPVLISEESDCSQNILEGWIQKTAVDNDTIRPSLMAMKQMIEKVLDWMRTHSTELIMKHSRVSVVRHIISQFEYLVREAPHTCGDEAACLAVVRGATNVIKQRAVEDFHREMQLSPWFCVPGALPSARLQGAALVLSAALLHSHVLLLGPPASGKSELAEHVMRESFGTVIVIDCTPVTEPSDIIAELKRRRLVCGDCVGRGRDAGLLLRSLHRAARDVWGSVRVHDFLLQLIQEGGFWSMDEGGPQWQGVSRFTLLATATTAAELTPRLSSALLPVLLTEPDTEEIVEFAERSLRDNVRFNISGGDVTDIVRRMLALYKDVCETFRSSVQPHYSWTRSHICQWCENIKLYCPTTTADVLSAIKTEATMIFRERLITGEGKCQYDSIAQKHLRGDRPQLYYRPKLRNETVYLEAVDRQEWYNFTNKSINQCYTDDERALGEVAVEACEELAVWTLAAATALSGSMSCCVSAEGAGRRAGARLAAAALGASLHNLPHERHLHSVLHDALSCAVSGRALVVVHASACSSLVMGSLEAMLAAESVHSLPAAMAPSTGSDTPSLTSLKQNLGIMICLDKDRDNLRKFLEEFPLLHSSSRMCWLEEWSVDTLREMPSLVIQRLMKEDAVDKNDGDWKTLPVDGFLGIYRTIDEDWLRAPLRYLHFIKAYYHILSTKRSTLLQRQKMLAAGVEALSLARDAVEKLREEAGQQEVALEAERQAADEALRMMGAAVRAASRRREDMQRLRADIQAESEKLLLRKKEIETELESVAPVVASARAAVGDIRPEALSEVRSLRAPPEVVRDVLEGVLRLMGIADTSWHSMKNFLSKRGVKEDIRHLDAAAIGPEAAAAVSRLVERRPASFAAESARRASAAAAPLAAWVIANLEHAKALARVRPLQERQTELQQRLRAAEEEEAALSAGLAAEEGQAAELQDRLGRHSRDGAALEHRLRIATDTLRVAGELLNHLAEEAASWKSDSRVVSEEISELNRRSLLSAAYSIYLPHWTERRAREELSRWGALSGLQGSEFSVIDFLSSPEQQDSWRAEGLPSDLCATKNAVVLHQHLKGAGLRALVVDPEGSALAWLRVSAWPELEVVSGASRELSAATRRALGAGRSLLVTEAEQLPVWWWAVPGAENAVLLTRDATLPHCLPLHLRAGLAPLLFTSQLDALTDQLVNYAVEERNPEMFEKWKERRLSIAILQKRHHESQERLLRELSARRAVVGDESTRAALDAARAAGSALSAERAENEALEGSVAAGAAAARIVALPAARLALAVRQLAERRPLVTLPTTALRAAFLGALELHQGDLEGVDSETVTKHFLKKTLERVMLGVHEKERDAVLLHLIRQMDDRMLKDELWQLLVNNFNLEIRDENLVEELEKKYSWLSKDCIRRVAQIKMLDEELFTRLPLGEPGVIEPVQGCLSPGETALTAAALCPERLQQAVRAWLERLTEGWSSQDTEKMSLAVRCSGPCQPGLLLAPHAGEHLAAAAAAWGRNLILVSVEEGRASWEEALQRAQPDDWLAIAVGASPFPRDLIIFVESIAERSASDLSDEFRLWILAEEREIPNALTSNCVPVILEPASGVRLSSCGALEAWSARCPAAGATRLAAGLALLHAVVIERRDYIPIGWSQWYDWSWSEWRACGRAMRSLSVSARPLCLSLYAARVSQRADRAVLSALEERCLSAAPLARLPPTATLQECLRALVSLPSSDSADMLHLPLNCHSSRRLRQATLLLDGLRECNSTTHIKQESAVSSWKVLQSLWRKMMEGSPFLRPDYRVPNRAGWWGVCVSAEARDAFRACRALHAALGGAGAELLQQVPEAWHLWWTGPNEPRAYLSEFCERVRSALHRTTQDFSDDYLPTELDLRSFLRPSRALSVLRAHCSERLACPPAALRLVAVWDPRAAHIAEDPVGVRVSGLSLSGARWRRGALQAPEEGSPPLSPAPSLELRWVREAAVVAEVAEAAALIPLYDSPRREAVLCHVRAPLGPDLTASEAALYAVALVVTPNY